MGFLRRGNKKKDKTLPASPAVATSSSSPELLHLNLSNQTMLVINNKENNNRDSNIQTDNGYTNRSTVDNSLTKSTSDCDEKMSFNARASSSPTSLTDDIFLELDASETNTVDSFRRYHNNELSMISSSGSSLGPIKLSGFLPTDTVPDCPTTITSLSGTTTSLQEIDILHSNNASVTRNSTNKEGRKDVTPPTATIGESTRGLTGTILFGRSSPVNSNPGEKGSSSKLANLSSTDSASNAANIFETKPALFKHKIASIVDSDASESEEEEEEEEGDERDDRYTASSSSSNIASEINISSDFIKQREEQTLKGAVNKTTAAAGAGNRYLLGGNSASPSQATLMARMKERHRRECHKSWQPMGKQQQHHLYLQRVTPTMPTVYTMDTIISPGARGIPISRSSMSFAAKSHLPAASSTIHYIGGSKQKHHQHTVHRPRLSQSSTMPHALDIVSRDSMDVSSTPWRPATSVTTPKRDSTVKKSNRSARASSWPSSESHHQQRQQQKNIFSNGPASIEVAPTSSTMSPPSSPTRTYQQQQQQQKQRQRQRQHQHQGSNVVPRSIPMTPPPDPINSPTVPSTRLTQTTYTSTDLTLDIKNVPRKVASELQWMHENRSRYSLPDLSQFATTQQQQQLSQNDYSQLVEKSPHCLIDLKKEALGSKINKNNNAATITTTSNTIEHHKALGIEEGDGTTSSSFSSGVNGMELGYNHLLPLGDMLPTVLVAQEAGSSQYYLVLPRDQHSVLSALQCSQNTNMDECHHHHKQQEHTAGCSMRHHRCHDCAMRNQLCHYNHNQQRQYQHHHCRHLPSCNVLLTKSAKRQSKRNRSDGKLCDHHQQQQQKQRMSLSHQHHRSTCVTHKEKQQDCHQHCGNHYHTRKCSGSLYSISKELKSPSALSS